MARIIGWIRLYFKIVGGEYEGSRIGPVLAAQVCNCVWPTKRRAAADRKRLLTFGEQGEVEQ